MLFLLVALNYAFVFAAPPSPGPGPQLKASTPSEPRFLEADQAFRERRQEARGREALKLYREFYHQTPKDPEAAWRVSMACYFVGIRLTPDMDARKKLYAEGRDAGFAGAELDHHCAPCHFWGAINTALYGDAVGVFKMIFSLGSIKDHLVASIQADPKYAYGGAHRLLGMIYQKVPGILGGSDEQARKNYVEAIEVAPDEPLNYLFLARLQDESFGDRKGAIETAKKGLEVPPPSYDRIESVDALEDIRTFLREHQDKRK